MKIVSRIYELLSATVQAALDVFFLVAISLTCSEILHTATYAVSIRYGDTPKLQMVDIVGSLICMGLFLVMIFVYAIRFMVPGNTKYGVKLILFERNDLSLGDNIKLNIRAVFRKFQVKMAFIALSIVSSYTLSSVRNSTATALDYGLLIFILLCTFVLIIIRYINKRRREKSTEVR